MLWCAIKYYSKVTKYSFFVFFIVTVGSRAYGPSDGEQSSSPQGHSNVVDYSAELPSVIKETPLRKDQSKANGSCPKNLFGNAVLIQHFSIRTEIPFLSQTPRLQKIRKTVHRLDVQHGTPQARMLSCKNKSQHHTDFDLKMNHLQIVQSRSRLAMTVAKCTSTLPFNVLT